MQGTRIRRGLQCRGPGLPSPRSTRRLPLKQAFTMKASTTSRMPTNTMVMAMPAIWLHSRLSIAGVQKAAEVGPGQLGHAEDAGADAAHDTADRMATESVERVIVADLRPCRTRWRSSRWEKRSRPMTIAAQGSTKPAAGVMTTRPATRPVAAPTSVGLPTFTRSTIIQETSAAPEATTVLIRARRRNAVGQRTRNRR